MKTLTTKGVTTGRTAVAAIPSTTIDQTTLLAVNVSNPDTKPQLVVIRINTGGAFKVLKETTLAIGVKAIALITHGQPLNGETIVIDGKTYTYEDELTDVDGNVHIGGSASATRDNLRDAMNLGDGEGTDYAESMTVHPTCTGVDNAANLDVQAKDMGTYANDITIDASDATNVSTVSPLAGGIDKSEVQYNTPVGLALGDILEVVLGRAAATTELDYSCSYLEN